MSRHRPRRSARSGFTLLEVMLSISVMLIGVMGIISLQRATIHANYDARATSIATVNMSRWAGILRRSAMQWTDTTGSSATVPYLSQVGTGWFIPQPNNGAPATDHFGMDWYGQPTSTLANVRFCTLVRLQPLTINQSMRADILTFWARQGQTVNTAGSQAFAAMCQPGNGAAAAQILNADNPGQQVTDPRIRHARTTIVLRRSMP